MPNASCSQKLVSDLGEFGLIGLLTAQGNNFIYKEVVGAGDDCAVIPSSLFSENGKTSNWLVVTTDVLVENVHFRLDYAKPFELGMKCLAVSLSDIAAMGASPLGYVVTLQLRNSLPVNWIEEFYRGLYHLGNEYSAMLLGGDTVAAQELAFGITALGVSKKPPLLRSGAKVGDEVWVSGSIGGAGAGFYLLEGKLAADNFADEGRSIVAKQQAPIPRVELGKLLLEKNLANALIDISDGLLQDARHIAVASDVAIKLNLRDIPIEEGIVACGYNEALALSGGEDYELLFSSPKAASDELARLSNAKVGEIQLPRLSKIGVIEAWSQNAEGRVLILTPEGKTYSAIDWIKSYGQDNHLGYDHFR